MHYDLDLEFRQFVIEYDINHTLIKKSTVDTFLREKPFTHILREKPDDLKEEQPTI